MICTSGHRQGDGGVAGLHLISPTVLTPALLARALLEDTASGKWLTVQYCRLQAQPSPLPPPPPPLPPLTCLFGLR